MNKKAFIRWQIKEWLPLFIGFGAVTGLFYWLASYFSAEFYGYGYTSVGVTTPMYVLMALIFAAAAIFPIAIFSYQTNHIRADFYDQIPLKNKELRRIRVLIGIIGLLALFTVIFWIGVLITYLRQVIFNQQEYQYFMSQQNANPADFKPYYFNYVYYIPFFFVLALGLVAHYFTCVYLASLGNRVWDSILYIILGEALLNFALQSILLPSYVAFSSSNYNSKDPFTDWIQLSIGFYFFLKVFIRFYGGEIAWTEGATKPNLYDSSSAAAAFYIGVIGFLLVGAIAAYLMLFKKKDPAGELAGRPGARNGAIALIPHAVMLMLGFLLAAAAQWATMYGGTMVSLFIFVVALWATAYFLLLFASRGTIRFEKKDWIIAAVVAGIVFVLCLSFGIVYANLNR